MRKVSQVIICAWLGLWLCPAVFGQLQKKLVINEFMASNSKTLSNGNGKYSDWVEIYNPTSQTVDMAGMFLTDDLTNPTKWQFPQGDPSLTVIDSHDRLLIWADGEQGSELHAGFSLSADGEALGLFDADGALVDSVTFTRQMTDVSYGRYPDGGATWQYMASPTPTAANKQGYLGVVEDVNFAPGRGFYESAASVTLTCPTPGAEIWYSLDTTNPHTRSVDSKGVVTWSGQKYTGPIAVSRTTCIRAVAIKTGWMDSLIVSHSYLFLDDIIRQSATPAGFPTSWGYKTADYAMDQRVVNDAAYSGEIKDDLKSIPAVCIVIPNADFFGTNGIYANPDRSEEGLNGGLAWGAQAERMAGMEWIDPCTGGQFGLNAGLRIQGGYYARTSGTNRKYGLQFFFRAEYGKSRLDFPMFADAQVKTFSRLGLREIWNYSWIGDGGSTNGGPYGSDYLRDLFARDTVRDLGSLTSHGRPVNVYINGLYWGMYILTERIDDDFAADYLGGKKDNYDVLEAPSGTAATSVMKVLTGDGTTPPEWNTLFALAAGNLATSEAYQTMQQYVDVNAMIDYMLMVYYTGSRDGPTYLGTDASPVPRNFYAIRSRDPAGPFVFVPWDTEWCLEDPTVNRVTVIGGVANPQLLMIRLSANPEFKMLLADRIHSVFHNGGPLTREAVTQRYQSLADEIYGAIVGESARWGDLKRPSKPFTRADWQAEVTRLVTQYFSGRTDTVLGQLKGKGWYPAIEPPTLQIDGQARYGGAVRSAAVLTLVNPNASGTLYYTLDGSDPRLPDEGQAQPATTMTLVAESAAKKVLVPTSDIGTSWRGNDPFDDSAWKDGTPLVTGKTGGVGYDTAPDYLPYITYNVQTAMYGKCTSCYIRIPFTVKAADLAAVKTLTLRVRCDDGYVAFLNGVEVASIGKPDPLTWNAACSNRGDSTDFAEADVSAYVSNLHLGTNVLAVHALNTALTSSDFLFSAELTGSGASGSTQLQVSPTAVRYAGPITLNTSTQVKARVLANQWSALSEATYAVGPVLENLRISELMYHPVDPNAEFIELTNTGSQTINLALVRFTKGVDFEFPAMDVAPGQYTLVVADASAFALTYGSGLPVAGQYVGSLSNSGERIKLRDSLGRTIEDFTYADNWYPTTDGGGYSLVVRDVKADPSTLSSPDAWRPSAHPGGTPGKPGL
jgi:hypothetical protein